MAAKFFTGLPLDGPDPECVLGHGEQALAGSAVTVPPRPSADHSRPPRTSPSSAPASVPVALLPVHRTPTRPPDRPCHESPLAGSGHGG